MTQEALFGKSPDEIKAIVEQYALPRYTATQLTEWL
jgi:hypothetical protein